jgi:hypothetical protein
MRALIALSIVAAAACAPALAVADDDIAVAVSRRGSIVVVDVQMRVPVSAREAWAVLTDYEHMARFVSNLKSSAVLRRDGANLEVEQIGEARRGPFAYTFETVRSIELVPYREIRSKLLRGPFNSYAFTTRIVDGGDSVVVVNHGEYEPTTWVPPVLGPAMIETETRRQYGELRDEMLRRKRLAVGNK